MNKILFVTNKENFQIFNEKGILGFKERRAKEAANTNPGDLLVCYIGGEKKIGGIVKIESEMYEDLSKLFTEKTPGELYPYRFKCSSVINLASEKQIPIEYFFDKLELFANNRKYLALQGQVHYLSEKDFSILQEEIKK